MKILLWALVMLAITGFLTYLSFITFRYDRKMRHERENSRPQAPRR